MADFEQYLKPGKRGHLIGAGGVSMAPLAEVLAGMGLVIDGSDMAESEKTRYLRTLGIDIKIGHSAMNVAPDIQFVVRTAAVHDDNPEIVEAKARGVPVFERAQAWGAIMRDYDNALCIAGTHGKTTTTSMCTHILVFLPDDSGYTGHRSRPSGLFQRAGGRKALLPGVCLEGAGAREDRREH